MWNPSQNLIERAKKATNITKSPQVLSTLIKGNSINSLCIYLPVFTSCIYCSCIYSSCIYRVLIRVLALANSKHIFDWRELIYTGKSPNKIIRDLVKFDSPNNAACWKFYSILVFLRMNSEF